MPGEHSLGLSIFGLYTTPSGLGVAASNTTRVLEKIGLDLNVFDIDAVGVPRLLDGQASAAVVSVNLFHVNPNWIELMLHAPGRFDYRWQDRLNVCVPFWELPLVSADWVAMLSLFDVVLAPSHFIEAALLDSGLETPVIHVPQAAFLPERICPDRERFGIDPGCVAYCLSFAPGSLVERKNPWAAIESFTSAFPDEDDVRLVVRVHVQAHAVCDDLTERLRARAAADSRIILIDEPLTYEEVLGLYASCDVYLSLHRSEGLGLGPMEAMTLGKAVVATGWSGNMDFMTEENSRPVDYMLVPAVLGDQTLYGPAIESADVLWAEPNLADAAAKMRDLYEHPGRREALGARAMTDMSSRRETVSQGVFVKALRVAHADMLKSPAHHHARAVQLSRMQRAEAGPGWLERAKRRAVGMARRLHLRHDSSQGVSRDSRDR